jgi:hypothetical protein
MQQDREAEPNGQLASGPASLIQIGMGLVFTLVTYGIPLAVFSDVGEVAGSFAAVVTVGAVTVLALQMGLPGYLYYWLSLVIFQNAFVGVWLPDTFSGAVPLIVTEMKTVSLLVAILLSLPQLLRFLASQRRVGWFVAIYFGWIVISVRALNTGTFAYGRNFIFPLLLLLFIAARTEQYDRETRLHLLGRLLAYTVGVTTIGVLAEIVVGTAAWRVFLNTYKLVSLGGVSETTRFFGLRLERTAGFIVEPTNAGYIAAICAVLLVLVAVASRRAPTTTWWILFVASVWLLIESGARSGFLMLFLSLVVIALSRLKIPPARLFFSGCTAAFAIVLVYVSIVKSPAAVIRAFSDPPSLVGGDSTTFHLAGLMSGISKGVQSVIGRGLGVGGNFSSIGASEDVLRGTEKVATGGESAWGVLAFQTGIVGLIFFIAVLILIGKHWGPFTLVALIVWSVTAMFAEASFGLQVSALIMIGAALFRGSGQESETMASRDFAVGTVTRG